MKISRKHRTLADVDVRILAESVGRLAAAIAGRPRLVVTPESWLSPQELADLVGKSGSTVRRWIHDCGLPAKKVRNSYLVRYCDFTSWNPESDPHALREEAKRILDKLG